MSNGTGGVKLHRLSRRVQRGLGFLQCVVQPSLLHRECRATRNTSPRILQDVPRFVEPTEPAKSGCPPVISIFFVRLKFESLFKFLQRTDMITDIEKRMSPDKVKHTGPRHTFGCAVSLGYS